MKISYNKQEIAEIIIKHLKQEGYEIVSNININLEIKSTRRRTEAIFESISVEVQ